MADRLTDRIVKGLPVPASGNRIHYDSDLPGFGVRVTSAGARAFILNYRAAGRERRITIGQHPAWNVSRARERAAELRRQVDAGADPMAERHAGRAAPTVNDLADRFEAEHLPKKRPTTQREYRRIIRLHIRPALGSLRVADVRHADIERLHRAVVKGAPYGANRAVAVVSKMLNLAVRWEMRTDNPARGIERAPEQKRERFLTPAEIARLGEALAVHPERTSANAVRLLLLTGARKGETLAAQWKDFDLEAGVWSKPAATTKTAKRHRVPLSAPALTLLVEMKSTSDIENARRVRDGLDPVAWVFPGVGGKPLGDIKHFWAAVCRKADLAAVRVHDLRHTYASILASAGLSLPIIGQLLGHTQTATTARYAHLMDDPLRAATERAGAVITGAGREGAEVVQIPGRRAL
ncbi:MAG TPA: site-specific integrase [Acetobacteraceae bacterium]